MHKKNAIKKENWLPVGDWYIHPDFNEITTLKLSTGQVSYLSELPRLLAHKCTDGKIGRVIGGGVHKSKRSGFYRIYGKCFYCKTPVGDEIHTLINMIKIDF